MKVVKLKSSFKIDGSDKFTELANNFFKIIEAQNQSMATIRSYAYDLVCLHRWLEHNNLLWNKKISQKDLQSWMIDCNNKNLKPRSINRRLACARVFYRFCFGQHIPHSAGVLYPKGQYKNTRRDSRLGLFTISRRPLMELKVKVPKAVMSPLKPQEVDDFLKDIHRYRDIAIVLTMLLCGLRSQEIINLKLEDIDFHQSQLLIKGKGKKERMVPLSFRLMEVFEKYLSIERPQQSCPCFFVILQGQRVGQPMTNSGIRSLFRYRRLISRIAKAKPHQFRHTFASDLARAGVPITTIQKLLGHADPATSEIYIQLFMEDIRAEYEKAMTRIQGRYAALKN